MNESCEADRMKNYVAVLALLPLMAPTVEPLSVTLKSVGGSGDLAAIFAVQDGAQIQVLPVSVEKCNLNIVLAVLRMETFELPEQVWIQTD